MKFLGANWKTLVSQIGVAIFSLLTVLAALPYTLGDIATIIPPEWKTKVVTIGIVATFVLRILNGMHQKDKDVTGGNIQQTQDGSVAAPVFQTESSSVAETQQAKPKT